MPLQLPVASAYFCALDSVIFALSLYVFGSPSDQCYSSLALEKIYMVEKQAALTVRTVKQWHYFALQPPSYCVKAIVYFALVVQMIALLFSSLKIYFCFEYVFFFFIINYYYNYNQKYSLSSWLDHFWNHRWLTAARVTKVLHYSDYWERFAYVPYKYAKAQKQQSCPFHMLFSLKRLCVKAVRVWTWRICSLGPDLWACFQSVLMLMAALFLSFSPGNRW